MPGLQATDAQLRSIIRAALDRLIVDGLLAQDACRTLAPMAAAWVSRSRFLADAPGDAKMRRGDASTAHVCDRGGAGQPPGMKARAETERT
jgi:hypothetical protein